MFSPKLSIWRAAILKAVGDARDREIGYVKKPTNRYMGSRACRRQIGKADRHAYKQTDRRTDRARGREVRRRSQKTEYKNRIKV